MNNKKKLYFVCRNFHPDTSSTSVLMGGLLNALAEQGWQITVLCAAYGESQSYVELDSIFSKNLEIERHGHHFGSDNSIFFRLMNYFIFSVAMFFRVRKVDSESNLLGCTNPPFNIFVFGLLFLLGGSRRQVDYFILDLYPDGIQRKHCGIIENFCFSVWRKVNSFCFFRFRYIYVLGRDMEQLLIDRYGVASDRVVYFPHWSAIEPVDPLKFEDSPFVKKWNLEQKFVVQYSGNMGLWHDLETFVKAAHYLRQYEDIIFVFIGEGLRKPSARKLAYELKLENILWQEFVDLRDLQDSLAACHVSLISLRDGLEGIAVPCKYYGILSSARCVLASVPLESEISKSILEDHTGVRVDPGDVTQVAESILRLRSDLQLRQVLADNAYATYREKYSLGTAIKNAHRFFT